MLYPPATSTTPLGSRLALAKLRAEFRLAAGDQLFLGVAAHAASSTGRYAARKAVEYAIKMKEPRVSRKQVELEKARIYAPVKRKDGIDWKELNNGLCRVMQNYCGDLKSDELLNICLLWLKDIEKNEVIVARRDNGEKKAIKIPELVKEIPKILENMQKSLFEKSKKLFKEKVMGAKSLDELKKLINDKKVGIVPLCTNPECEDIMKAETKGAKALFIADEKIKAEKCIICKKKAEYFVYSGKSY